MNGTLPLCTNVKMQWFFWFITFFKLITIMMMFWQYFQYHSISQQQRINDNHDRTFLKQGVRPGSNVQNIQGIFQKSLHKSAAAHGQNIKWNIPLCAAVCYVFVPFLKGITREYSIKK